MSPTRPLLAVSGVRKHYGGVAALDGAGFVVGDEEVVGMIGANGAGKTTLFDTISGFVRPDAGSIVLRGLDGDDVDLARRQAFERASLGVGRTFQNARLFSSLTVLDNLRTVQHSRMQHGFWTSVAGLGRAEEAKVADRAREVAALVGLEPHLDKPAQELSYGMLRLCELACVVALAPRLLLLDEPSSGMAQREVEALPPILEAVRSYLSASIVLIEHDMPFVLGMAHRVVAMASGRVIAQGTPKQVMADPEVIESYLGKASTTDQQQGSHATSP
ncbi:MAG: ABC transporter ATP-binding protein [Acidimicrobiales bacterium]